jgi:hypothetical protein
MNYQASPPFTHHDSEVRQARFEAACRAAAELTRQGKTGFAPVVHSSAIAKYGLPFNWTFWQRHDQQFMHTCDEVLVLTLPRWKESVGVQAEIAIARDLGKPVWLLSTSGQIEAYPAQD